jgi:hypothetical protein
MIIGLERGRSREKHHIVVEAGDRKNKKRNKEEK